MQYSSICFDLDGTLLDSNKTISDDAVYIINKIKQEKVKIIIASGRRISEVKTICEKHHIQYDFCISCDGSYIYRENRLLYSAPKLYIHDAKKIQCLSSRDVLFASSQKDDYIVYFSFKKYIKEIFRRLLGGQKSPCKVLFVSKNPFASFDKFIIPIAEFVKINTDANYTIHLIEGTEYHITNINANKYIALSWLSKRMQINLDEMLYFGDDTNDIECFRHIKHSVAMDNASIEIKHLARYHAPSNDMNGVFEFLCRQQ